MTPIPSKRIKKICKKAVDFQQEIGCLFIYAYQKLFLLKGFENPLAVMQIPAGGYMFVGSICSEKNWILLWGSFKRRSEYLTY